MAAKKPTNAETKEPTNDYRVLGPIEHDGIVYRPDTQGNEALITLTEAQAAPLLALAVIDPIK